MRSASILERLGFRGVSRVAILHADDVGMCHGANMSYVELTRKGALTCGSVMVPCPWFPEIAGIAAGDAMFDLGVHLTLTSEWTNYRWGPLTRASRSSGLIDDDGYFHRTVAALAEKVEADAAEAEMRAQIDRAIASGLDITHLDTHMGGALCPPLIETYCRVGRDYNLPVLLPRQVAGYAGVLKLDALGKSELWQRALGRLDAEAVPLVDDFRMTPGVPTEQSEATYRALIETFEPGVTFVALHPNTSGDIETIVPPRAHYRTDEHRILGSGLFSEWLRAQGVETIGMRALRDLYRNSQEATAR